MHSTKAIHQVDLVAKNHHLIMGLIKQNDIIGQRVSAKLYSVPKKDD